MVPGIGAGLEGHEVLPAGMMQTVPVEDAWAGCGKAVARNIELVNRRMNEETLIFVFKS